MFGVVDLEVVGLLRRSTIAGLERFLSCFCAYASLNPLSLPRVCAKPPADSVLFGAAQASILSREHARQWGRLSEDGGILASNWAELGR